MAPKLSPQRQALIDEMKAAADRGEWDIIPGRPSSLRWMRTLDTPPFVKPSQWPGATYDQLIFLTPYHTGNILLRVCRCPWLHATDTRITIKRAREILADPAAVFDR